MTHSRKRLIVALFVFIGILAISVTAYGAYHYKNKIRLTQADSEIIAEMDDLSQLEVQIEELQPDKSGYLPDGVTAKEINQINQSLKALKSTYADFHLNKNELKRPFAAYHNKREHASQEFSIIKFKFEVQEKVNKLYTDAAIDGTSVHRPPIADDVGQKQVDQTREFVVTGRKENSKWLKTVNDLIDEANDQVKQIAKTKEAIRKLNEGSQSDQKTFTEAYNSAKAEIDKIKNKTIKKALSKSLSKILARFLPAGNTTDFESSSLDEPATVSGGDGNSTSESIYSTGGGTNGGSGGRTISSTGNESGSNGAASSTVGPTNAGSSAESPASSSGTSSSNSSEPTKGSSGSSDPTGQDQGNSNETDPGVSSDTQPTAE